MDNSNLTLISIDSLGNDDLLINGFYRVEINGFENKLLFLLGRAHFPGKLKNSTLMVVKPLSESSVKPSFYILWRWGEGIYPQKISFFWILTIPTILILLCFWFRKLIVFVLIGFGVFYFLNKGINPLVYFRAIWEWILHFYHN